MAKPKFDKTETDKENVLLRRRVKILNKLIHKENKTEKDRIELQKLLEEECDKK